MIFTARKTAKKACSLALFSLVSCAQVYANGPIGEHVNHLQDHLEAYTEEVDWLIGKIDGIVTTYEAKGAKAAEADKVVDYWEEVDFHSAIETNYVPLYASIWQGLYGVKESIDNEQSIEDVRKQQEMFEQSLWQSLGAVKLAAQFQDRGLLEKIQATETAPTTMAETMADINTRLDRVVAKYAEQLPKEATAIVHDTYLNRFEGVEGTLIEQKASLVEDLEKDFNVTLPKALADGASVDEVKNIIGAMKVKLGEARELLVAAEENRKEVF